MKYRPDDLPFTSVSEEPPAVLDKDELKGAEWVQRSGKFEIFIGMAGADFSRAPGKRFC